jgi:transposase
LTTKLHVAVNGAGIPVRIVITPGQSGDAPQAEGLLKDLQPTHVIADTAYDSDAIRKQIRQAQGQACIRPNKSRKTRKRYDKIRYRNRNVIERFFGAIKRFRRVATRYEKKAANFLGFVWIAALLVHLK